MDAKYMTCPDCGHKQELRDDWKPWIRERMSNKNNTVHHICEAPQCDYQFNDTIGKFMKLFPEGYIGKDKNGCW